MAAMREQHQWLEEVLSPLAYTFEASLQRLDAVASDPKLYVSIRACLSLPDLNWRHDTIFWQQCAVRIMDIQGIESNASHTDRRL